MNSNLRQIVGADDRFRSELDLDCDKRHCDKEARKEEE